MLIFLYKMVFTVQM